MFCLRIGETNRGGPSKHAGSVEVFGEEDELDVCSNIDYVKSYRATARASQALTPFVLLEFLFFAFQIRGIIAQPLSLHFIRKSTTQHNKQILRVLRRRHTMSVSLECWKHLHSPSIGLHVRSWLLKFPNPSHILSRTSMLSSEYFNQILTAVHEVLDDSDSSIRVIAISLIVEMLNNQKEAIEDSLQIIVEKLLHATKDVVAKVAVPLLVNADEKTLVTCINYLTKLVGLLSEEELMSQLPSFFLALFDAFGNQSPDVQKSVVFCLVAIYIKLGKAFLPYLEGLSST